MKVIGIREVKDHLSEYIRQARSNGPVYISRHGEIVAELRVSYGPTQQRQLSPGLQDLVDRGLLRPGRPRSPGPYPLPEGRGSEASRSAEPDLKGMAVRLLDQERGDR